MVQSVKIFLSKTSFIFNQIHLCLLTQQEIHLCLNKQQERHNDRIRLWLLLSKLNKQEFRVAYRLKKDTINSQLQSYSSVIGANVVIYFEFQTGELTTTTMGINIFNNGLHWKWLWNVSNKFIVRQYECSKCTPSSFTFLILNVKKTS